MDSSDSDSSPPSLEELSFRGAASFLLPLILANAAVDPQREVAVFVHPHTRSVTIVEGAVDNIDSLLRETPLKGGPSPATKSSIEALPRVRVSEPGLECSICLAEYEVDAGAEAKRMPCGHEFHGGCIDRWLGIHGSCPVCRFSMAAEEENKESGGFRVHLFIVQDPDSGTGMDMESEYDDVDDELSAQEMELDNID